MGRGEIGPVGEEETTCMFAAGDARTSTEARRGA